MSMHAKKDLFFDKSDIKIFAKKDLAMDRFYSKAQ